MSLLVGYSRYNLAWVSRYLMRNRCNFRKKLLMRSWFKDAQTGITGWMDFTSTSVTMDINGLATRKVEIKIIPTYVVFSFYNVRSWWLFFSKAVDFVWTLLTLRQSKFSSRKNDKNWRSTIQFASTTLTRPEKSLSISKLCKSKFIKKSRSRTYNVADTLDQFLV